MTRNRKAGAVIAAVMAGSLSLTAGSVWAIERSGDEAMNEEGRYRFAQESDIPAVNMSETGKETVDDQDGAMERVLRQIFTAEPLFQDLTLIDAKDLTVTFSCDDEDLSDGLLCRLSMTNHMDEPLAVYLGDTALNNLMCNPSDRSASGEVIPAGESVQSSVEWTADELMRVGINQIDVIDIELHAYRESGKEEAEKAAAGVWAEIVCKQEADQMTMREPTDMVWSAVSTDDYRFDILECTLDEQGYPVWKVWIENHTEQTAVFAVQDAVLNGYATEPSWQCSVLPGKMALSEIHWWTMEMDPEMFKEIRGAQFAVQVCAIGEDGIYREIFRQETSYYPYGETAVLDLSRTESEEEGLVLDVSDRMKITLTDIEYSSSEGYYILKFKLDNNSVQKLRFSVDRVTVSDAEIVPKWLEAVPAASVKECTLSLDLSDHKDIFSAGVQEMELHVTVQNDDGEYLADDLCRINPTKFMLIKTESLLEKEDLDPSAESLES